MYTVSVLVTRRVIVVVVMTVTLAVIVLVEVIVVDRVPAVLVVMVITRVPLVFEVGGFAVIGDPQKTGYCALHLFDAVI